MTVAHSTVWRNRITANAGGILMTDEFGPTFRNTVAWNHVWRNQYDCGITIPGHSPNALSATGQLQPTMGGVYRNLIVHNVVNRNGLKGEGAGILIAAAGPGSAAYSNTVAYNTAIGNNLAGVTIHSHAPNQDVNDNRLIANTLSNNNRGGDPDAGVSRTADVLIFSAVVPITGTIISGNWLSDAHFGIWTQTHTPACRGITSTTSWCTSTKARRALMEDGRRARPRLAGRIRHVRQWSGSQPKLGAFDPGFGTSPAAARGHSWHQTGTDRPERAC